MHGTIKKILREKSFGFIRDSDGDQEYFFHRSCCDTEFDTLREGQKVKFEVMNSPKGPRAEQVTAI